MSTEWRQEWLRTNANPQPTTGSSSTTTASSAQPMSFSQTLSKLQFPDITPACDRIRQFARRNVQLSSSALTVVTAALVFSASMLSTRALYRYVSTSRRRRQLQQQRNHRMNQANQLANEAQSVAKFLENSVASVEADSCADYRLHAMSSRLSTARMEAQSKQEIPSEPQCQFERPNAISQPRAHDRSYATHRQKARSASQRSKPFEPLDSLSGFKLDGAAGPPCESPESASFYTSDEFESNPRPSSSDCENDRESRFVPPIASRRIELNRPLAQLRQPHPVPRYEPQQHPDSRSSSPSRSRPKPLPFVHVRVPVASAVSPLTRHSHRRSRTQVQSQQPQARARSNFQSHRSPSPASASPYSTASSLDLAISSSRPVTSFESQSGGRDTSNHDLSFFGLVASYSQNDQQKQVDAAIRPKTMRRDSYSYQDNQMKNATTAKLNHLQPQQDELNSTIQNFEPHTMHNHVQSQSPPPQNLTAPLRSQFHNASPSTATTINSASEQQQQQQHPLQHHQEFVQSNPIMQAQQIQPQSNQQQHQHHQRRSQPVEPQPAHSFAAEAAPRPSHKSSTQSTSSPSSRSHPAEQQLRRYSPHNHSQRQPMVTNDSHNYRISGREASHQRDYQRERMPAPAPAAQHPIRRRSEGRTPMGSQSTSVSASPRAAAAQSFDSHPFNQQPQHAAYESDAQYSHASQYAAPGAGRETRTRIAPQVPQSAVTFLGDRSINSPTDVKSKTSSTRVSPSDPIDVVFDAKSTPAHRRLNAIASASSFGRTSSASPIASRLHPSQQAHHHSAVFAHPSISLSSKSKHPNSVQALDAFSSYSATRSPAASATSPIRSKSLSISIPQALTTRLLVAVSQPNSTPDASEMREKITSLAARNQLPQSLRRPAERAKAEFRAPSFD